jgi:hypothetical protein
MHRKTSLAAEYLLLPHKLGRRARLATMKAIDALRQIGTAPANGSRNPSVRQAVVRLDQSLVQRAIHAANHIDPKCFLLFPKQDASKSVPPGVEKICAYIVKGPTFFG